MKRYDSEDGAMVPRSEGVFVLHEDACASLKHMREHFEAQLAARDKRIAELEAELAEAEARATNLNNELKYREIDGTDEARALLKGGK